MLASRSQIALENALEGKVELCRRTKNDSKSMQCDNKEEIQLQEQGRSQVQLGNERKRHPAIRNRICKTYRKVYGVAFCRLPWAHP